MLSSTLFSKPRVVGCPLDHPPYSSKMQFLFRNSAKLVTPAARQSLTGRRSIDACPPGAAHLTKTLASYTVTIVTLAAVSRWRYGLKNSSMSGALAAAPGNAVTPSPFIIKRSVLWCWYRVVDW